VASRLPRLVRPLCFRSHFLGMGLSIRCILGIAPDAFSVLFVLTVFFFGLRCSGFQIRNELWSGAEAPRARQNSSHFSLTPSTLGRSIMCRPETFI
jgi:hypothetical protein